MKRDTHQYLHDFSHSLDLIAMAMSAGLDFYQALDRVIHYGPVGMCQKDLAECQRQISLGKPRIACFQELAKDTKIRAIQSLAQALQMSENLGANLAQTLDYLSRNIRQQRLTLAEAKAQQIPTKLIFPLVFLVFPCIFIVLFAPVLYRLFLLDLF